MIAHSGRKASTGMTHSGIFLRLSEARDVGGHRLGRHHGLLGRGDRRRTGRRGRLDRAAGIGGGRGRSVAAATAGIAPVAATETERGPAVAGALQQMLGNFGHGRLRAERSASRTASRAPSPVRPRTLGQRATARPRQGALAAGSPGGPIACADRHHRGRGSRPVPPGRARGPSGTGGPSGLARCAPVDGGVLNHTRSTAGSGAWVDQSARRRDGTLIVSTTEVPTRWLRSSLRCSSLSSSSRSSSPWPSVARSARP